LRPEPDELTRRGFLERAGIASAISAAWAGGLLDGVSPDRQDSRPDGARETLDALLGTHRARVVAADGRIGGTMAHVPLALMALYRIGASPAQMRRFFGDAGASRRPAHDAKDRGPLTVEDWRRHLRTGVSFRRWFAFFDGWMAEGSVKAVLDGVLPTLIEGGVTAFDHSLIHMSYAIDYGGREEIACALALWANTLGTARDFDQTATPVEPAALLDSIVRYTSDLKLSPRGGDSGSIAWRLDQVWRYRELSKQLKPVVIPEADPLGRFSEIILALFCEAHEFTMLHALTTCHALRSLLVWVRDPKKTLAAYWHSVCASWVTVRRMPEFEGAREGTPTGGSSWVELTSAAVQPDSRIHETQYVHRAKLVYSCRQEFEHTKRDLYRAVAAREVERASEIILG
jgi:hypothetical protein